MDQRGQGSATIAVARRAERIRLFATGSTIVLLVGLLTAVAVQWADQYNAAAIADQLRIKIDGFADHLQSQLQWFDIPPAALTESREITELFDAPREPGHRDVANAYLKSFNTAMHASISYIMDTKGLTLAASNFEESVSLVGRNYGYRPYFKAALAGGVGRYVAVGATTHVLGYYVAVPIRSGNAVRGVAVVKYTPASLLSVWHDADTPIAIADENGVIFASSDPQFRFHTLGVLGLPEREEIAKQKEYPPKEPLTPLPLLADDGITDGAVAKLSSSEFRGGEKAPSQLNRYVIRRRHLALTGWHVLSLGNLDRTTGATVWIVIAGVLSGALALLLFMQVEQRRASRRTLALNEARLRAILETSPIGASVTTLDGNQLFCSARYCELFGYPREEIARFDVSAFYINPQRRLELLKLLERDGIVRDQEAEFRRSDGSRWWGLVSWDRVTYESQTAYVAWCYDITERKKSEAEIRLARDAAETAYRDLKATQANLIQAEKMASLGQLTAGIAHEIKNPLNFVNNFSAVSVELVDELGELLKAVPGNDEIEELADMLRGNLEKIVQHGKRADSIVKNMLQHARQGSSEHHRVDINHLVEESLNLAYHGAKAERRGFNITLKRTFDPAAGEVDLYPQEITRVLLNLISNSFYATKERQAAAENEDYEATLKVATKDLGECVEIVIRDNGTGIPPEVKEKLFTPFFTTKPAGEGTGLGLSMSYDIVVSQHGGRLEVETKPGEFTEFHIILPRTPPVAVAS